jgi:hypothetical protein
MTLLLNTAIFDKCFTPSYYMIEINYVTELPAEIIASLVYTLEIKTRNAGMQCWNA